MWRVARSVIGLVVTSGIYFALGFFSYVLDCSVVQPHTVYLSPDGVLYGWFKACRPEALAYGLLFAGVIAVISLFHFLGHTPSDGTSEDDLVLYPRIGNLPRLFQTRPSRLVLILGVGLLAAYYVTVLEGYLEASVRPHGLYWPPKWIFVSCVWIWSVCWLADSLQRPRRATLEAAIGFAILAILIILPSAFGGFFE